MSEETVPAGPLCALSVPAPAAWFSAALASSAVQAAWLHGGEGFLAFGEAASFRASGPERFTRASAWFSALASGADVTDRVHLPGSGLCALGSFAFSADSPYDAGLLVPRLVIGMSGGHAFVSALGNRDEVADPLALAEEILGASADKDPAVQSGRVAVADAQGEAEYTQMLRRAVALLSAPGSGVEKVVLSARKSLVADSPFDVPGALSYLAGAYPSTWTFLFDGAIGASPEMLTRTRGREVFSRVLAGSRPVPAGESEAEAQAARAAFLADKKERFEHALAIESVTERIGPLTKEVTASVEPFVLQLPGLEHLASDVHGTLRDGLTSLDVAATLHPSAAVCGTPRDTAAELIVQLEVGDRGHFAGPIGWMDANGDGEWAIALRTARLESPHEATLYAGGGIVASSDPAKEWREVNAKMLPMLRALGAAGRG
ncbi:isochorismate synthase [Dermabacteraceae bacterium CCM 9519]